MLIHNQQFEDRFTGICSIEGEQAPSGGDGGGGGGGAGGDAGAAPTNSGGDSGKGIGGAAPADAPSYVSPTTFSPPSDAGNVRRILDMEKDPDHRLNSDDIKALLGWNPKLGNKSQTQAPAQGTSPDGQQQPQPQAAPAEGQPPAAAATPPAQTLDPNLAALVERLDKLASTPAPTPAQPGQTPAPKPETPKPFYGGVVPELQVSPQLTQAIFNAESPEQAQQAMNVLVSGIMNRVMQDATQLMLAQQARIMELIPNVVTTQHQGRTSEEKFFAKHQELARPAFKPIVSQMALAIGNAKLKSGVPFQMDDKFLDEVADATHKYLEEQFGQSFRPKVAAAPAAPQNQSQQPKPNGKGNGKFFTPNGSRPPADPGGAQSADLRSLVI